MVVYNDRNFFGRLEYRFSSPPSQGGETGSTPVVAIENLDYMSRFFYLGDIKAVVFQVEPRIQTGTTTEVPDAGHFLSSVNAYEK